MHVAPSDNIYHTLGVVLTAGQEAHLGAVGGGSITGVSQLDSVRLCPARHAPGAQNRARFVVCSKSIIELIGTVQGDGSVTYVSPAMRDCHAHGSSQHSTTNATCDVRSVTTPI